MQTLPGSDPLLVQEAVIYNGARDNAAGVSLVLGVAAAFKALPEAPDQFPDRGYFYRSDQFNLAKIGVPAIYLKGGTDIIGQPAGYGKEQEDRYTDVDYHQPSDELTDSWNFEGIVQDAQANFVIGLRIANADAMPTWNAGDEFEAARLEALQQAAEQSNQPAP